MSNRYARAIVNPAAGGHSIYREWPRISRRLSNGGLLFDHVYTQGKGHAIELAREAVSSGYNYIIAIGGDGTVNEVINGILNSKDSPDTTLGIVSAGTTCSFARSVGIPPDPLKSCDVLTSRNRLAVDIGVVEYKSEGRKLRRFFINEADVGLGATVVEASKKIPNYLGRKINYLPYVLGSVGSLLSYKNKRMALRVEDREIDVLNCAMLVIANGTYFGGGMCIAPDAKPNDGLLDMVIIGDIGRLELLKIWLMTYKGQHISHEKVRLLKISKVDIQCNEKVLVEADGELLGEGPVSFSVLPAALNIVVQ